MRSKHVVDIDGAKRMLCVGPCSKGLSHADTITVGTTSRRPVRESRRCLQCTMKSSDY